MPLSTANPRKTMKADFSFMTSIPHGEDYGPKARFIPAWANGPGHRHTQTLSANGAIHPRDIVRDGVMNGAWRWDKPGFQPLLCLRCITWGVARALPQAGLRTHRWRLRRRPRKQTRQ